MSRRIDALALLSVAVILLARPAPARAADADPFAAANQALQGREATILLAGCRVVEEVKRLVLSAETTRWRKGGRAHSVPTSEVLLVVSEPKRKWRAAAGAAVGFLGGLALAAARAEGRGPEGILVIIHTVGASTVTGGVLGATVFAKPGGVVYEAPGGGAAACGVSLAQHAPPVPEHVPDGPASGTLQPGTWDPARGCLASRGDRRYSSWISGWGFAIQ